MIANIPFGSTIYISGKMSGVPCFNFKNFFYWQVMLEKSGYKVVNPAEIDCLKMIDGWEFTIDQYEEVLENDLKIIRGKDVDAVFVIGDNYVTSEGACREIQAAADVDKPVYYENDQRR